MKIERMTQKQFADMEPQTIGSLIKQYQQEINALYANPIDLEQKYTKQGLQQIAAAMGTAARTIIMIDRKAAGK